MKITSMLRLFTKDGDVAEAAEQLRVLANSRAGRCRGHRRSPPPTMPSSLCCESRRASSWLARVHPTMIARRACVASMSSARVIDCSSSCRTTSSTGVTQHPRHDHAARILLGELGDVAERQQAGDQHGPAPQQVGGELEAARDHLRGRRLRGGSTASVDVAARIDSTRKGGRSRRRTDATVDRTSRPRAPRAARPSATAAPARPAKCRA